MSADAKGQAVFFEIANGVLILRFQSSRFTLAEAIEVRDLVYEKFSGTLKNVILNLNGVDYIDSAAISLIVRVSNELGLRITNVSPPVVAILSKMQLFDLLYVLPSEYEARRSFYEA
jgi:anti-anti-sigma factor